MLKENLRTFRYLTILRRNDSASSVNNLQKLCDFSMSSWATAKW